MEQARDLANYHEHAVFTDPELDGIGNIAGQSEYEKRVGKGKGSPRR